VNIVPKQLIHPLFSHFQKMGLSKKPQPLDAKIDTNGFSAIKTAKKSSVGKPLFAEINNP